MLKTGMGLSIKRLLDNYFSKEQIRDALRDIGEPASGNKDRLGRRLRDYCESQNRNIYELLDFTNISSLEMICHHYKLDATFKEKDALKGKIEKANLLVLDKKTDAFVKRNHDSLVPKTRPHQRLMTVSPIQRNQILNQRLTLASQNTRNQRLNQRIIFHLKKFLFRMA